MPITIDQMKDRLLTESDLMSELSEFNGLAAQLLTKDSKIGFSVDPEWILDEQTLAPSDPIKASMTIDGTEHVLSKEAFYHAAVNVGLPQATVKKIPARLTQSFLNEMYRHPEKECKVLALDSRIVGFAPAKMTPFSNTEIAETIIAKYRERAGQDAEVYADYKFHNSLTRTDVRLIFPDVARTMEGTDMEDVPSSAQDDWCAGIHLSNSLMGKSSTSVEAYLFRWWCTNGAINTISSLGKWDRRVKRTEDFSIFDWASDVTGEILDRTSEIFDHVQSLADLVVNDPQSALAELFAQYNLPARQQTRIMESVIGLRSVTMYSLMQAITESANDPELDHSDVDRLLRIGGEISGDGIFSPMKAAIWSAGHQATPGTPNPFEWSRS